jgi:hypothetical protein
MMTSMSSFSKLDDPEETKPSYVANLTRGPILFTAVHSCVALRGGEISNTRVINHNRE